MISPDVQTLRAIHALSVNPEFRVFLDWLKASHEDARNNLESAREDEQFRVAQGEARTLKEIVSVVNSSREALDRAAANTRR